MTRPLCHSLLPPVRQETARFRALPGLGSRAEKGWEGRGGALGSYLEQEEGRDDVVGHVEVVPHAGLVERKPFEREHQLGSKWRVQFTRHDPRGPQNCLCAHCVLSVISWNPLGSTGVKVFSDKLSPREGRLVPSHTVGTNPV